MRFNRLSLLGFFVMASCGLADEPLNSPATPRGQRPVMRDFMGLNVHTVGFKPDLYKPICRLLRDYHPIDWDFGNDTSRDTKFPLADNRVDWSELYGKWTKAGYEVDACLMFDQLKPERWKDSTRDARAYGEAFARFFGPSGQHPWVTSAEIGNEPANYSAEQYRKIFEAMARGLRAGDPKLRIATCAVATGKVDKWSKPLSVVEGLQDLYDVVNVHCYPFKDLWPTWRRSYPEDPSIRFLKTIQDLIDWRNAHAPGKPVWLTEFGYDAASKPPAANGEWKQWVGMSDAEQARYIVRAYLVLSALDIERAYLYFFNDQDESQLHGASGVTRNYKPKPSFYAISQLYRILGDYRFERAVVQDAELYCYEYRRPNSAERVYVAWLPIGTAKSVRTTLPLGLAAKGVYRAERMATSAAGGEKVDWTATPQGVELEVSESLIFLWTR